MNYMTFRISKSDMYLGVMQLDCLGAAAFNTWSSQRAQQLRRQGQKYFDRCHWQARSFDSPFRARSTTLQRVSVAKINSLKTITIPEQSCSQKLHDKTNPQCDRRFYSKNKDFSASDTFIVRERIRTWQFRGSFHQ